MPKAKIRNHVRRLRAEHEMSQQELARRAGCTRQTIILLEQERYSPSLALALRIARTFRARVDDVFQLLEDDLLEDDPLDDEPGADSEKAVKDQTSKAPTDVKSKSSEP